MSQINASHCEAKKHSYRQTQDGVVISFVLHPNEVPEHLTLAALGTRFMLAFAEIGDDEKQRSGAQAHEPGEALTGGENGKPRPERKRWNEMATSQRAALLCRDPAFQFWAKAPTLPHHETDDDATADWMRGELCIHSRRTLDLDDKARERFEAMEAQFMADTGRAPSPERR